MFKPLRSRKYRALARRKFLIAPADSKGMWSRVDHILRHPVALLVVGFAFTGLLGSYISFEHDARQKQKDATVKSFDALRAATDDLHTSLAEYYARTGRVLDRMKSHADTQELRQATKDYDEAYIRWMQRLTADNAIILQSYKNIPAVVDLDHRLKSFMADTESLDDCIQQRLTSIWQRSEFQWRDTCTGNYIHGSDFDPEKKLRGLNACVSLLAVFARQDPRNDFDTREERSDSLALSVRGIDALCIENMLS